MAATPAISSIETARPAFPRSLPRSWGTLPPFRVNLLVVTHCHSDHIGCLPRLVRDGILEAEWALVADERLGFGRPDDDAPSPLDAADLPPGMRGVVAALLEESRADVSDADLAEFLQDAATLEPDYKEMLQTLTDRGTNVVRYNHEEDLTALVAAMQGTGLKILGPTQEHLLICAAAIEAAQNDAVAAVRDLMTDEADFDAISAYRAFAGGPASDAADSSGTGAEKNDQSIVLSVAAGGWKALLTADMQFAKAEVPAVDAAHDRPGAGRRRGRAFRLAQIGPSQQPQWHRPGRHRPVRGEDLGTHGRLERSRAPLERSAAAAAARAGQPDLGPDQQNGRITARRSGNKIKLDIQKGSLNNAAPNRRQDVAPPPVVPIVQPLTADRRESASLSRRLCRLCPTWWRSPPRSRTPRRA